MVLGVLRTLWLSLPYKQARFHEEDILVHMIKGGLIMTGRCRGGG